MASKSNLRTIVTASALALALSGCNELELSVDRDGVVSTEVVAEDAFALLHVLSPDVFDYTIDIDGAEVDFLEGLETSVSTLVSKWAPTDQVVIDEFNGDLNCFATPIRQMGTPTADDEEFCSDLTNADPFLDELFGFTLFNELWMMSPYTIPAGERWIIGAPAPEFCGWTAVALESSLSIAEIEDIDEGAESAENDFKVLREVASMATILNDGAGLVLCEEEEVDEVSPSPTPTESAEEETLTLAETGSDPLTLVLGSAGFGILLAAGLALVGLSRNLRARN